MAKMAKRGRNPKCQGYLILMDNLVHIIIPIRKEIATTLHKIVGTIAPRKKGQGGRGMGHGGHANAGKVKRGNKVSRAPIYPPKALGAETTFSRRTVRRNSPLPTNGSSLLVTFPLPINGSPMKHVLIMSYVYSTS